MIAFLTGRIRAAELEVVVLDVAGVGYEVFVPLGLAGRLTPDADGDVSLWIHTSVREDAIQLYGFLSQDDRRLFRRLISVNGIGPKIGLATLSELTSAEVVLAVAQEDIKTFTRVSGIGNKTAQRIILELKNRLDDFAFPTAVEPLISVDRHQDLRSALLNLGYQSAIIGEVIEKLDAKYSDDEPMEALLRRALKMLS